MLIFSKFEDIEKQSAELSNVTNLLPLLSLVLLLFSSFLVPFIFSNIHLKKRKKCPSFLNYYTTHTSTKILMRFEISSLLQIIVKIGLEKISYTTSQLRNLVTDEIKQSPSLSTFKEKIER